MGGSGKNTNAPQHRQTHRQKCQEQETEHRKKTVATQKMQSLKRPRPPHPVCLSLPLVLFFISFFFLSVSKFPASLPTTHRPSSTRPLAVMDIFQSWRRLCASSSC